MSDDEPTGRWPSWGTAASAVSVLGAVILVGFWIVGVYQGLQTKPEAKELADLLRAEFKVEIANVRSEENRRGASDRQRSAWAAVQSKRIEVVLLRNRINDCDARKTKSQMEQDVCKQYNEEWAEAARVFERLQAEAMNASRGAQ